MLTASYDDETGIVTTTARGMVSSQEFDDYLPELTRLMDRSRSRHGTWLHLVDSGDSPVQDRATIGHIATRRDEGARGDGRTAYLVASMLKKMQMERIVDHPNHIFTDDRAAGHRWLLDQVRVLRSGGDA